MKKKLLLLMVVALCIATGCSKGDNSSAPSAPEAGYDTLEIAADAGKARIGEYMHPYYLSPGYGISFEAVYHADSFDVGQEVLEDVIVAEVVTDLQGLRAAIEDKIYFLAVSADTTVNSEISVATYQDADDIIYILLESESDLSASDYFVMGGLEESKNDQKARVIFEIGKSPS